MARNSSKIEIVEKCEGASSTSSRAPMDGRAPLTKKYSLIDIGLNLAATQFDKDRADVIRRAREVGVERMIVTGSSRKSSEDALKLAKQYPGVLYSTMGVHPHEAQDCNDETLAWFRTQVQLHPEIVAIGECGLDFDRNFSPRSLQEKWFEAQLRLAAEFQKPVFLHDRSASQRVVEILTPYLPQLPKVVIHCFTGTRHELETYLRLGCYIGITGWVCDERRGKELQSIVKIIPLDRLMIETDAPYLFPRNAPKRLSRNEPQYLPYVLQMLSQCMAVPEEEIARATTRNACEFFGLERISPATRTALCNANNSDRI